LDFLHLLLVVQAAVVLIKPLQQALAGQQIKVMQAAMAQVALQPAQAVVAVPMRLAAMLRRLVA
jgi:hypothetical protein